MANKYIYFLFNIIFFLTACSNHGDDTTFITYDVINYEESSENFCNPERGFYTHTAYSPSTNYVLTANYVKKYRDEGISLIFMTYSLKEFRDKAISEDYLNKIKANMQLLRETGAKAILRFSYTSNKNDSPWDAPWNVTENHIKQLTPIFEEYADVISVLEAGFIGVWGEWYYTTNYIMSPKENQYGPRKQVIDALLKAVPKERMIAVRTPKIKTACLGITYADSVTYNEAYDGSKRSRLAAHNDCVFASDNDSGTFRDEIEKKYWQNESKYYVMGGETCRKTELSVCENALTTFKKYHWSYLNHSYRKEVTQDWKDNGCFDLIQRHLGYRFVLRNASFQRQGKAGGIYHIKLSISNVGWAAPYNPRDVEIVFISQSDTSKIYSIKVKEDPRFWFADETINLNLELKLPNNMSAAKYTIYLNLPDPKITLAYKPEFSIRLANKHMWDENNGYNKLYEVSIN